MKKQMKLIYAIALAIALCFGFTSTQAQLTVGGGIAYGTEIESIGITLKGNYPFTEEWEGSGSFSYFFPNESTEFLKIRIWELNADAHYIVKSTEKFTFYPLAGLNIAGIKFDYENVTNNPFFTVPDSSTSKVGLNVGAGGTLVFTESLSGYAEVKYTISDFDQLVINVGVLFSIGSGSK